MPIWKKIIFLPKAKYFRNYPLQSSCNYAKTEISGFQSERESSLKSTWHLLRPISISSSWTSSNHRMILTQRNTHHSLKVRPHWFQPQWFHHQIFLRWVFSSTATEKRCDQEDTWQVYHLRFLFVETFLSFVDCQGPKERLVKQFITLKYIF